ncbi:sugar kinase [Nonomuraea sp. NPDC049421]|uniref:carbohydrate kinase family protein n=1 Tax=unclassified Nonomuraea TaxID=2593643 RepID=UPI0033B9A078
MSGDALLIIGDVVTDVVALHGSPVLAGEDTAAEIVLRPGGSGANTAAWAACLGAEVHLLAKLGYDSSEWHATELINTGVQPHFSVDPDHPTAVVIAMVDKSGERSMLTNRGAGDLISEDDWDPALLDGVGRLHLSGYVLFAEPGLRLAARAMADAVAAGITVSVDPASTGPLRDFGVERFMQATAAAELILPNLDEALLLTGVTSAERAAVLLSERYGTAVVKLGAEGALAARDGEVVATAEGRSAEVVDSTGAGDAFAAGFIAATLRGAGTRAALEVGCRAGAACVAQVGGRPRYGLDLNRLYPIHTD